MQTQGTENNTNELEQSDENIADAFSEVIGTLSLLREHDDVAGYAAEDYLDEAVSALEAAQSDVLRA